MKIANYPNINKVFDELIVYKNKKARNKLFRELMDELDKNNTKYLGDFLIDYCRQLHIIDAEFIVKYTEYLKGVIIEALYLDGLLE